jgi:hypothetical protein
MLFYNLTMGRGEGDDGKDKLFVKSKAPNMVKCDG